MNTSKQLPDLAELAGAIAQELSIPRNQVAAAIELLRDGNTIPFIARYRKEATGGLDEISLRAIEDAAEKAETLQARKSVVLKSLIEQAVLTDVLEKAVKSARTLAELEEIYLPFRPKRRTRATAAREAGLEPLADLLFAQRRLNRSKKDVVQPFISSEKGIADGKAAIQGALDIVAERWAEDARVRRNLLDHAQKFGKLSSTVKRGKKSEEGADKFSQYFDRQESAARVPGHRVLAMLRGAAEGFLRIGIELDDQREIGELRRQLLTNRDFEFHQELSDCLEDCYERLLVPAIESSLVKSLREKAETEAINVFAKNLNELLMAPPAGQRVTIGIDPGFRTGCKLAVVDGTGKFLASTTIYPTPPRNESEAAGRTLLELVRKHSVELIAIGNGTASRETDAFVSRLIQDNELSVTKVIVSESGASIYSASEIAAREFPDLDLTVRGAISIARRLQDPLSELVKTDPKSIGVGQYQHDVNQPNLKKCLSRVVESCVNRVGVDVNMASASLLSHVSGIGSKLAEHIVEYRNQHGSFKTRQELKAVKKLGKQAFEQAAGFLRIRGGDQPLDNSAVHPESYPLAAQMAKKLKLDLKQIIGNSNLAEKLSPEEFVDDRFGLPTVRDIIGELAKPGRDPRAEFRAVEFNSSINSVEDLSENLILEGVITNVTHFGAFVDIGVHQDALIHISQLSNEFVSDPNQVVSVGDVVKVKVLEIDAARKRISATRKL